ncbi:hypothetical protein LJB77_00885 [Ruminococcaceae bacterium OttesenSCG-928-N02]|nr:hypothetical protein [Ruminococcaceae bacterium OttesenSCG-928-N02]
MKPFLALLKLQLISLTNQLTQFRNGKKKKESRLKGILPYLFLPLLFLYIGATYAFMFFGILGPTAPDVALYIMAVLTVILSFFFTFFTGMNFMFSGKDNDFLLSLPIGTFKLMLAKTLALYLETLEIVVCTMAPVIILYVYNGYGNIMFLLYMVLGLLFAPFFTTMLSLAAGQLVTRFTVGLKYKKAISTVLSFVLLGGIMLGSFQINSILNNLVMNTNALRVWVARYLPPLSWFIKGAVEGNLLLILAFIGFCILPFLLVLYISSLSYRKLLTRSNSIQAKADYTLGTLSTQSAFNALLSREAKRFFSTQVLLLNSGFGVLMSWGLAVFLYMSRASIIEILEMLPMFGGLVPAFALASVAFMLLTIAPASSSISLEGKTLWIIKEAPIGTGVIFSTKILFNFILCVLAALPFPIVLFALGFCNLGDTLLLGVLFTLLSAIVGTAGLCLNLAYPKLDAANETQAVKNSAPTFIITFGGMIIIALLGFAYAKLFFTKPFYMFAFCLLIFLAIALLALIQLLRTWGAKRFTNLA